MIMAMLLWLCEYGYVSMGMLLCVCDYGYLIMDI